MSANPLCNLCGKSSRFKCTGCLIAYYCSKDHQKSDWKNHKPHCIAYKEETSDNLGRHLVASRFINEGEKILEEKALMDGPAQVTPPVCLSCYRVLEAAARIDCSRCGWPMCSEICSRSESHRPECNITSRRPDGKVRISLVEGILHPSYQSLTVLRCLSLKKENPVAWHKLMNLESHCEERKVTSKHESDKIFIAKFIKEFFNFTDFSDEEILKVAGIVEVNAHEVPLRKPGYIAIYEKASLLEHNCRANCTKSFTNSGHLVIRAAEKISKGDHLSICYTDPLWGRTTRLKHLLETKFFLCTCVRCLDPTELGTHFNSVKCGSPFCHGYSVPLFNDIFTDDGTKRSSRLDSIKLFWECEKCKNSSSKEDLFEDVNESMRKLERNSETSCIEFLNKYKNILHENHHLMINVKLALIDLLGWPHKVSSLEDETLNWITSTCEKVYRVLKLLIPSENRLLGVLLYQLHFLLAEKGRRSESKNPSEVRENLVKCQNILNEAYKYLKNEPDILPEGMMAKEAKRALENISKCLE